MIAEIFFSCGDFFFPPKKKYQVVRGEGEPQEGDVFDQRGVLQRVSSRGWSVCSLWMGGGRGGRIVDCRFDQSHVEIILRACV